MMFRCHKHFQLQALSGGVCRLGSSGSQPQVSCATRPCCNSLVFAELAQGAGDGAADVTCWRLQLASNWPGVGRGAAAGSGWYPTTRQRRQGSSWWNYLPADGVRRLDGQEGLACGQVGATQHSRRRLRNTAESAGAPQDVGEGHRVKKAVGSG